MVSSTIINNVNDCSLLDNYTIHSLNVCKKRIENNFPAVIIVDGGLGTGKTTHDTIITDYISGTTLPFDHFLGMGATNFMSVYDKYKGKQPCLVYDEAGDFSRKGAMTKMVRDLGRIFETFRQYKLLLVISLPRFYWLDSKIYELDVVLMLIHCWQRGDDYCNTKVYLPDRIDWLVTKADELKRKGIPQKLVYTKVQPNFHGRFWNLPEERRNQLYAYSLQGKDNISTDVLMDQSGLISLESVAMKIGRSKSWTRGKLKELKIEPGRVYKTRNYYSKDIIGSLLEELRQ